MMMLLGQDMETLHALQEEKMVKILERISGTRTKVFVAWILPCICFLNSAGIDQFGIMLVPCKEEAVESFLSASLSLISLCVADKTAACCPFFVMNRYDVVKRLFSQKIGFCDYFLIWNHQFSALQLCQWVLTA